MVAQHSKQMPMAQIGPLGSPSTAVRNRQIPWLISAAATLVSSGIRSSIPSTRIVIIASFTPIKQAARIEGAGIDLRSAAEDLVGQQPACAQGHRDPQALVTGGNPKTFPQRPLPHQRQMPGDRRPTDRRCCQGRNQPMWTSRRGLARQDRDLPVARCKPLRHMPIKWGS